MKYKAGTYDTVQRGHNGPIHFSITFSDEKIEKIEVLKHFETPGVSDKALFTELPKRIINEQSLSVGTIDGASVSSRAVISAISKCAEMAGADAEALKSKGKEHEAQIIEKTADIIVIGSGGAGFSAAIEAKRAGRTVLIIEKYGYAGGNTLISGGMYNTPHFELQKEVKMSGGLFDLWQKALEESPASKLHEELMEKAGRQLSEYKQNNEKHLLDTPEWFALQTWTSGDKVADLGLVKIMAENSLKSLEWMTEMGFSYEKLIVMGDGALYPRSHFASEPLGLGYINAYLKEAEKLGIEVVYGVQADELIVTEKAVRGVKGKDRNKNEYTFNANKAVIIATGGFGGNLSMVEKYNTSGKWPNLSRTKSSNLRSIRGEGIVMAEQVGAALRDMEHIQLLYNCNEKTGSATRGFLKYNSLMPYIYINKEGKRFVREDGRRDEISLAMLSQTDKMAYILMCRDSGIDDNATDFDGMPVMELVKLGEVVHGETLTELCENLGIPYGETKKTVDHFNEVVGKGAEKDEFGRAILDTKLINGPWFATGHAPAVHHTMGGLVINEKCQVISKDGSAIKGLYAAGEVTGGIHGANRLGGNALVEVIVFGRIAGISASEEQ